MEGGAKGPSPKGQACVALPRQQTLQAVRAKGLKVRASCSRERDSIGGYISSFGFVHTRMYSRSAGGPRPHESSNPERSLRAALHILIRQHLVESKVRTTIYKAWCIYVCVCHRLTHCRTGADYRGSMIPDLHNFLRPGCSVAPALSAPDLGLCAFHLGSKRTHASWLSTDWARDA